MNLYCVKFVRITDSVCKTIKIYACCNECGCRKCKFIHEKDLNGLLRLFKEYTSKSLKASSGRAMLLSKYAVCNRKQSRFIKE